MKTLITILVDNSWSMLQDGRIQATVSGLNEYVGALRAKENQPRISLITFNGTGPQMFLEKKIEATRAVDVPDFRVTDFACDHGTPLLAAIQETIRAIEVAIRGHDDIVPILVIQTDGEENMSSAVRNYPPADFESVRRLIVQKEALGWEILFMGCGIDAFQQGAKMGLTQERVISYENSEEATESVFRSTAAMTSSYMDAPSARMAYSEAARLSAGETSVRGKS